VRLLHAGLRDVDVVELRAHRADGTVPTRQRLADELSGNLCRCTGYRPILDAGAAHVRAAGGDARHRAGGAALRDMPGPTASHYAPARTSMRRARWTTRRLREAKPDARLLAGSTDVGLWVNKQFRELRRDHFPRRGRRIAAHRPPPTAALPSAPAPRSKPPGGAGQRWPALTDVWLRFASPPIRHAGTMGGNVANGSPIGD
jgi:xanthine dehydrogenase small subunit